MAKKKDTQAIFSCILRGDARINILRTFCGEPDQAAYTISAGLKVMEGRDPSSFDMRDFISSLICAGRNAARMNYKVTEDYREGGFIVVEPGDPYEHLSRSVGWLYTLSKPYRALHIHVDQVVWEERSRAIMPVYSGLFSDYHKHIDGIIQSIGGDNV